MGTRDDLLRLPAGERQAVVIAAHRRAAMRLKHRYAAEYDAIYEDELAHPPEPGRSPLNEGRP